MRLKMLLTMLIVLMIFESCMAFVLPHSFTTFVAQGSNRVFNLCPHGSSDRYYRYTAASRDAAVHCAGLRAMQRGVRMAETSAYELAPKCTRKFQFVPYGDNTQKIFGIHHIRTTTKSKQIIKVLCSKKTEAPYNEREGEAHFIML